MRVDQLCAAYDKMFNVKDRIKAIQEVDGILANDHQYALHWYAPYIRLAFWNKFGAPQGYLPRTGDSSGMQQMWWADSAKDAQLQKALRDTSVKLAVGPVRRSLLG